MPPPDVAPLGDRLLDAQIAFHLSRLTGTELEATVGRILHEAFDIGARHQLADLVDPEAIKAVVSRSLTEVPASPAVAAFIELAFELVETGPAEPFQVSEVLDRDQVERVLDEALALAPLLERVLERLTASPLVGTVATRFMGRVVGEAIAANQAVADKVPGLGSLFSLGTKAAAGVVGAADKQLDGLLADTAGRGGTLAVRRLNRIIVETLGDPITRDAVLQVWDLAAAEYVCGLSDQADAMQIDGVVDAGHDLVASVLADPHVVALGHAAVDGFFAAFGGYTPVELLAELALDRDALAADAIRLIPGVVEAMVGSGELERLLRAELAPFYASEPVARLLADAD